MTSLEGKPAKPLLVLSFCLAALAVLFMPHHVLAYSDDYPSQWKGPIDSTLDNWGYYNRECTSFVAWRLHANNSFEMSRAIGNAGGWSRWARVHGYSVNTDPKPGSVAWFGNHVAWVEAVNGPNITVEEYNFVDSNGNGIYADDGTYSERTTAASSAMGFIHFKDLSVGTSQIVGAQYFIKTKNTGSGRVEIHSATASSNYQAGQHSVSWFSPNDADNGWFQMYGADLYFIKTRSTGSGVVEVHSATAASNYQTGIHASTWFSPADADNGSFSIEDTDRDGRPDVVFIKTRNTGSARIEIHSATAGSGYGGGMHSASGLSSGESGNGWFGLGDVNGDGSRDLTFIKTKNTGGGRIEIFSLSGVSGFTQFITANATWLSPADATNGWFSSKDLDNDRLADMIFIKTSNTGSDRVEIHSATSASNYQTGQHSVSWLSSGEASNGWFQTDKP